MAARQISDEPRAGPAEVNSTMSLFTAPLFTDPLQWDQDLIAQYDLSGPRYTSYPTAPQFRDSFSDQEFQAAVDQGGRSGRSLWLDPHIPCCDTLYCSCGWNKVVSNNSCRDLPYLERVGDDFALRAQLFDPRRQVTQLHWGGGTPAYISDDE